MQPSARTFLITLFLAFVTAAIYLPDLQGAPPFLSNDEACIALNARAIAATGRDVDGRFMPSLFYSPEFFNAHATRIWFLPILVYVTALLLKVLPFGETAIRLPLVLAGIADVLLVYFIAARVTRRTTTAVVAAILMALTPSHFFHARLALPAQISGPFVLGWVLCVLVYLERRSARWLFASGLLLGIAAIGYIGPLVIAYGLLTWAVLYQRNARWQGYAAVVLGGVVPSLYFLWLARDPRVVQDILGHYQQPAVDHGVISRLLEAGRLYFAFWSPSFLFVQGAARNASAANVIGVFLLPLVGLVLLGIARATWRRDAVSILLLGGFFTAPLTASFVGESHAIWRALEVAPFGVLLATLGLDLLLSESTPPAARWMACLAALGIPILVAIDNRMQLQHGQAMIRLLVVPLAIVLPALLFKKSRAVSLSTRSLLLAAVAVVGAEAAHVTRLTDVAGVVILLAAIATLPFVSPQAIVSLLGLLASEFLYLHVDYPAVSRVGPIPASAILMAMRATIVIATTGTGLAITNRLLRCASFPTGARTVVGIAVALVVLQIGYFYIDVFAARLPRLLFASLVLVTAFAASAALARAALDSRTISRLSAAGLLTAGIVQFGYFYLDYRIQYPTRNTVTSAGNVRLAWEQIIDDARRRTPAAVFVGPIGSYADAGLYWRFYLVKHRREDLLTRTVENQPFERFGVRRLPSGAVIVVSPTPQVDQLISEMESAGEIRPSHGDGVLRAEDGTPLFWIVERN